ncbi:patatin-like protein [Novosphingobium flavum]|uniref:Patatin-like protein n=1 Tax=Novosphingobium flavum TaxID=1778672 RepID=A0A7X1FRB2_9SPHN|nr:patatin-like protein [Novosphingobium flavum]MBC2665523.1 patatin-like protein [Novosphingobium flavum]
MQEKELRLALVYYGGVSLAIYQHGVNIEVLNLLRASKAYHGPRDFAEKQAAEYVFAPDGEGDGAGSTAPVYFDMLKQIGRFEDLRVVVDVISGSSAGGINGIVLARAIVHDLSLAPLTEMWLEQADILQLIAPEARAGRWSKWYFAPFMRLLFARMEREGLLPRDADPDIRRRLSIFVRSRWFKPPFDGAHFSGLLLDGLMAMERGGATPSSLLPPELRLDLMITVTDYHGAEKPIYIHDPPVIRDREHRQILRFQAVQSSHGLVRSDLGLADVPALAFAARASASYPGAFPPAQIHEMDRLVAARQLEWPGRERFLAANFAHYRQLGLKGEDAVLLDGSILNNKPLRAAIDAIRLHTAYREVDRRLVYIDPHPDHSGMTPHAGMPGFFATLRGALSDLPRQDPIYEELEEANRFNDQVSRLKAIARISNAHVEALLEQATEGDLSGPVTLAQVRHWRLTASNLLASSALVYNAWVRSLVLEAADVILGLVCRTCAFEPQSRQAQWARRVIEAWCELEGMFPADYHIPQTVGRDAELPAFGRFIVDFGIRYKIRRASYVIQHINSLYQMGGEAAGGPADFAAVDELKRQVNDCLRRLYIVEDPSFLPGLPMPAMRRLFRAEETGPLPDPVRYAADQRARIGKVVARIGRTCGLMGRNEEMDEVLSSPLVAALPPPLRRIVLTGYLAWPYWDVVVLPAMNALGLESSAFEEVLVDRISPADATSLCIEAGCGDLRGVSALGFGGFLSRAAREHDYLWGRIHAIDRLIDIVASTVDPSRRHALPDFSALKKRAFAAMLDEEANRLANIPTVLAAVREAIARL